MTYSNAMHPSQRTTNYLSTLAVEMLSSAGVGYMMAHFCTHINPVHGAVFCAVSVPVSRVVGMVTDAVFNGSGANGESKFIGQVVNFVVTTAISTSIAAFLGFPLTFQASVIMGIALFAGWCLVTITLAAIRSLNR